jgi:zona occludens toxin (predicted ATPase)
MFRSIILAIVLLALFFVVRSIYRKLRRPKPAASNAAAPTAQAAPAQPAAATAATAAPQWTVPGTLRRTEQLCVQQPAGSDPNVHHYRRAIVEEYELPNGNLSTYMLQVDGQGCGIGQPQLVAHPFEEALGVVKAILS